MSPQTEGGQVLIRSRVQHLEMGPGTAGGSFEGQYRSWQLIRGPGRPGGSGVSAVSAELAAGLAGGVPFQAADDLFLGDAFPGAPAGLVAGGGVGAHRGDHDPSERVAGLAVAAGAVPVASYLA